MDQNKDIVEAVIREKQALVEIIESMDTQLKAYKDLGTPEEITEALDKGRQILEKFENVNLNTVSEDIEELKKYREFGSSEDVQKALVSSKDILESYLVLGSPIEVDTALNMSRSCINSYKKFGSPASITETLEKISAYEELGTVEELNKALDILEARVLDSKCEQVAAKFNSEAQLIRKMYDKVHDFKVVESLLEEGFSKRTTRTEKTSTGNARLDESNSTVKRLASKIM